jgi:hypothetical protein
VETWEKLKGWRTVIFGVLLTVLGGLEMADVVQIVGEQWAGFVFALIGAAVIGLRVITTGHVGDKT